MRFGFIISNCVAAGSLAFPSITLAAENIDCAIEALQEGPEYSLIGYENILAFADPKQPFDKSGSSMDMAAAIETCAATNGWSEAASKLASQYTIARGTMVYSEVQMAVANAPEDFGKKLYNDMSAAELKILRKTGVLSKTHMALVASTLFKYFGAKPEKGAKEMLIRWPQMLEDRDIATTKFLKLAK
jgi:hypothetical protein